MFAHLKTEASETDSFIAERRAEALAEEGTPPRYLLRHFYDPGSGVCLWAANGAARERFGYAVDLARLALPLELQAEGERLIAHFDTSLDWDYPPNPSLWCAEQNAAFEQTGGIFLNRLRAALGPEYLVLDERKPVF